MATVAELEKKVDALAAEIAYMRAKLGPGDDVYTFTDEERALIGEAMQEVARGEIASDKDVKALYKKYGL